MHSTEFFITSLIVVLMPGTGVIYTVSTGLTKGTKASLFAAVGCTLGIIPHMTAGALGLAAILHTSAIAYQVFKACGALYLAYLAWVMWKESGVISFQANNSENSCLKIALRAFLINILNPKLSIFFLAFLPQFVTADKTGAVSETLLLGGMFMLMTAVVFIGYGLLANQFRFYVAHSPKMLRGIQRVFAGLFVALGVRLVALER